MKKVKLVLDELAVESFATAEPETEMGTVRGHDNTVGVTCAPDQYSRCGPNRCDPYLEPTDPVDTCIDICG